MENLLTVLVAQYRPDPDALREAEGLVRGLKEILQARGKDGKV